VTQRSSRSRVRLMDELIEIRSRSPSPVPVHMKRLHESDTSEFSRHSSNSTTTGSIIEAQHGNMIINDSELAIHTICESDTETVSSARSDGGSDVSQEDKQYEKNSRTSSRASSKISSVADSYYSNDFLSYESSETSPATESKSRSNGNNNYGIKSLPGLSVSSNLKVQTKDRQIQTGLDTGDLYYYWHSRGEKEVLAAANYGLSFVDPASIAATVVSTDTLEALTGYSPTTLALNDMLKMQLSLTCQFLSTQKRLHQNLIHHLDSTQTYTTLKETKEFIKKHRKPQISMKEALKQVRQEMKLT